MTDNLDALYSISSKYHYLYSRQLLFKICTTNSAVIKGEPLSLLAYGKYGKRCSNDIDILMSKDELQTVEKLLSSNGYSSSACSRADRVLMLACSHQISPWSKPMPLFGNSTIDLNFDLFWGEYTGKKVDIDRFLSDTITLDIYGVKVKTLPPLKAMVQLILHHYKDMNNIFLLATRKSIKYEMFKDVYYLLKNNLEAISLDKLYDISAEYDIIPYVYYVLYHTGQLYSDKILQQYIEAFKTPEGEILINCYGLNESERREWRVDFKTRLESENLYDFIKDDLTERDKEKIAINRRIFLGESE